MDIIILSTMTITTANGVTTETVRLTEKMVIIRRSVRAKRSRPRRRAA